LLLALPARSATRLQPVPILMYHVIGSPPAGAPYPDLYLPRADFAAEVAWLAGQLNLEVRNLQPVWGVRPPGVRKLVAAGWELDAHTLTHRDLTTVDAARLKDEVAGSRETIRKRFHVPVNFFCYPAGRYDDRVIAAVQQAGYLGATTTRYGLAQPSELYTLARVRVNGTDGAHGLAAKLEALTS
jgi:hypothetical protein